MRPTRCPPPDRPTAPGAAPTFSVAIPAYQAAATIAEAIESVLAQTVPALEIVVCDDGSTDDLDHALRPYRDAIVLVRKENGGEGSAKDAATRAASGDFVAILDADDAYLPERLEAFRELAAARPDLDILTTDAFLEANGEVVRHCYTDDWRFEVDDQRLEILRRNFVFGAAAIRRERLLEVGGFDHSLRYAADWDLAIRMTLSGSRAGLVCEPLYRYRIGRHALSAQGARFARGVLDVLEKASRLELHDNERRELALTRATRERELLVLDLREALETSSRGVRPAALAVARERGLLLPTRLRAAGAAVAPRAAARVRRRRSHAGWVGAGGTFVADVRPPRLLAYTDATTIGGAEISLGNLLAELSERYEVTVVGVSPRVVDAVARRRRGAETVVLPEVRRKHEIGRILTHLRAFRRARPDIVHVSLNTPWSCQYGILAALLVPRARIVLVEQWFYPGAGRLQRAFKQLAERRVAAHVAVGERSSRDIERLVGLRPGSVHTIYNGVPELGVAPRTGVHSSLVVGSIGRLDAVKAYDVLIEALPSLPAARALLVGAGPERERLEARARQLGVADRLEFAGWSEDARAYLGEMDVFVLPSRMEGFPLAIVEAMLAARPVVATDVGSVREAVLDGETGLLVAPDDPAALTAAIRRLEDEQLRARMGAAGRARALALFTADTMARAFESLYAQMLK